MTAPLDDAYPAPCLDCLHSRELIDVSGRLWWICECGPQLAETPEEPPRRP